MRKTYHVEALCDPEAKVWAANEVLRQAGLPKAF